jgi:hypothetical protein
MKIGFAKADVTPRVGVELSGFGPFITRHSIAVRDRLWARAMAVRQGERTQALISCDLIGVQQPTTDRVRRILTEQAGLPPESVMVHCTHTHSGPGTGNYIGWGAPDQPYLEILPQRIAQAALSALANVQEAELRHAEVPCEGIGRNREYDRDNPPTAVDPLDEAWRPSKPDLTDATCHVIRVDSGGRMIGFLTYFGCHPVVCCQETHYVHGDYCGVGTNMLERENPGSVGLFLQGANGDVNSCFVHRSEQESLLALDIIAARFARAARAGLAQAEPLAADSLAARSRRVRFSRAKHTAESLKALLAEQEKVLWAPDASDTDRKVRMAAVCAVALRRLIAAAERGESLETELELQGFRIGPMLFLASPFETFQAIKNDVRAQTGVPLTFVMSVTNDTGGYAPDRTAAARGGYAADTVPLIIGALRFTAIHDELVREMTALAAAL